MTELAWLTVAEASGLLRARKLSPVEYATALLDRIARLNPRIDAFIRVCGEHAMAAARRAEAEIAAGGWRGPWHGVPYGLKDIIDFAGLPTTAHSAVLLDNVASAHAHVTSRIEAAGAVFLGKLATHEFAIGGPIFDLPFPPARNPWNRDHHPGGSSSGSGAALAAGLLPFALGTDTGGSVRNPASACAIVGMKPTYGLVSRAGVVPLAFSLDHVGPMTRTVRDNAMLLNLLAGHDPADIGSARTPAVDYAADLDRGVKGMRIGIIRHFHARDLIADPEMAAAIEKAVETLAGLGAEIREIEVEPLDHYLAINRLILSAEAFAIHEKWLSEKPEAYGALTRERLLAGAFYRSVDYLQALRARQRAVAGMTAAMEGLDAVVAASAMEPPCAIEDPAAVARTYPRQARQVFNVTGHPAISVPTGFSRAGLPLAMQIVGHAFEEATVYRVAHAYEQAAGWHTAHPKLDAA
ncbi:MAG: amidase [Rhodospirillales bacterium]|nr:MAG: amidase [Rhodospirillales bacterium]